MPSFIHLTLLLLLHICYTAALPQKRSLPPVYRPITPRGQPFTANKRWEVIGLLLSRSTCTFLNGQTCTGQTCCVALDETNGCCTHDCCGNGCCDPGYSCVLAEVGVTSCCPSGSSCGLPPATAYVTNTVIQIQTDVMVSIDTVDNTVLNTVQNTVQNTITQTGAAVTQTQFQTQTVSETVSALVLTTVNSQGQTITEVTSTTLSIQVPAAQSSNNPQPTPSPTPIGAIVGGAVGGFAALALLVFLIVLGVRRGWFSPKPHQPYAYPNGIDYSPHPGFSPEK